jgi:septum formation protein
LTSGQDTIHKLILASASPRRKALLEAAGLSFEVVHADAEELSAGDPELDAVGNARRKARCVSRGHPDAWVLGADTVVALGNDAFGKPADLEDARRMLRLLAGRTHDVWTGICVVRRTADVDLSGAESSRVTMRPWDPERIEAYLSRVNLLDKAGAYAIQEHGDLVVDRYEGDYTNIVGLPLSRTFELLSEAGFPFTDWMPERSKTP